MATETAIETSTQIDRPRVLVVDDEYGPRESIAFTLGTEFDVDTAERAAEALAKIKQESFAVIILDIRMPEMDGIKALAKIRELDREVAVVMLTGYGTLATAQQAMVGGANQYLRKPPDIEELLSAVRRQASGTVVRREEAKANLSSRLMLDKLKREMSETQSSVWQGRASVELVHDLANPLTVMIGYSGLLTDEADSIAQTNPEIGERIKEYSEIIERASEYCHHLAENWRQTTRKSSEFADVDLVALTEEVKKVIFFGNQAISIQGVNKAVVRGARFELARVLQNLLRNALEAGATELRINVRTGADSVEVELKDNGEGMDETVAKEALKGGFTTKPHGTGLGLSICRHLLGAHGATMGVESEPGEGTTIRLVFPSVK
ncbi:ATP-binding response regulator [Synoicihabitans lomoniglobus]|uniref:histidine kinase n=1 Tax=Synoicihabitans lomoniglobus TaxID=2909285 RepID=A0AAE9ZQ53_9BACT|nr:hybrid sensor histidine kinase/response regulator [Opitutaceae bacterium LMO-M01]WED62985.1 hybrid sensor histidine kinase/response regulator [Opitutaceae bacterium LMO-M01]